MRLAKAGDKVLVLRNTDYRLDSWVIGRTYTISEVIPCEWPGNAFNREWCVNCPRVWIRHKDMKEGDFKNTCCSPLLFKLLPKEIEPRVDRLELLIL